MARKLATALLVERLAEWGVDTVFGLPGDSLLGFPEYRVRFSQPLRFAAFASSCGALGLEVEKAAGVEPAIRQALGHPGPALVDVMVNPGRAAAARQGPLRAGQGFAQAWLRGQPRRATIASTLFRDKLEQLKG